MNNILKSIILILMLVITLNSLIYYFNPVLFKTLVKEDGIIENITAFVLLLGSMFLLIRLIKVGRLKNSKWIIFNILMIVVLFFGFGEEISWGQRIFSIESNDFFSGNNLQGETNLHNLKLFGLKINIIVFTYGLGIVFGFYIFLATILFKKNKSFNNMINNFGVPLPRLQHSIYFVLASLIITTVPQSRTWELWECFNALLLFLILIHPYNDNEKLIPTVKI
jgi:hypothetical protein